MIPVACPECAESSEIVDPNVHGMSLAGVTTEGVEVFATVEIDQTDVACPACAHVWTVQLTTTNIEETP
jgi:hypothetical protein